jgi:MFS family permease
MLGLGARLLPYALAFTSSLCIMILELVSSRLVARHVGSSLTVWTSVIGIILGGICLGNVLGGRLADRVNPRRAVGSLFALGSFLTLTSLWVNAYVGYILPDSDKWNWEFRTVVVIILDFLIPATVLGMVGPVVAKIAVEQARKAGSAIGDVYFWGAVGSIAGTFICGFVLMYYLPTTTIVLAVASVLAFLAAGLLTNSFGRVAGLFTGLALALGSIHPLVEKLGLGALDLGSYQINYLALAGNGLSVLLLFAAVVGLIAAGRGDVEETTATAGDIEPEAGEPRPKLYDLATLAFIASLVFMSLEMVAGRLVQRHLGSSIYGWTSVIGVLLAGLSIGNLFGGKIADFVKSDKQASWLFLFSSVLLLVILLLESPPKFLQEPPESIRDSLGFEGFKRSVLSEAVSLEHFPYMLNVPLTWPFRILTVVTGVFFLPALLLGTVSPIVAKLAIDRLRRYKRTGTAIGEVYAWGMVGSILGTFLTGFVLIDVLGTRGVLLVLAAIMAFAATMLGSVLHAVWAGIPLGLCIIAFVPVPYLEKIGRDWGIREQAGNLDIKEDGIAWVDETDYYYIKVENEVEDKNDVDLQKRTLVLDNLIHGYFILDHPERLDYDYEHIYALVAYRAAKAAEKIKLKQGSTPPPEAAKPDAKLAADTAKGKEAGKDKAAVKDKDAKTVPPKGASEKKPADAAPGLAIPPGPTTFLPAVASSDLKTLFLGGGAYCFQRHMQFAYPGTAVDVAEIDPAVTNANMKATGLSPETTIQTYWGDARQFVERHQDTKKYDLIFGDAFNDFSVPWHLTTREFNEKLSKMLTPTGVYMINIIDAYESDEVALKKANTRIEKEAIKGAEAQQRVKDEALASAHRYGGFVGAWTRTAMLTFPNVYIFGTSTPGKGQRETFVVVASKQPLDLVDLGLRADDPKFSTNSGPTLPKPYSAEDFKTIVDLRSRQITLSDDYAPVENLLAPVAETRADD